MNRSPIYRARRSRGPAGLPARKRLAIFLAAGLVLAILGADLGRGLVLSFQSAGAQSSAVAAGDSNSLTLEVISRLSSMLGGKPASASQPLPAPTARPAPTLTPVPQALPAVVPVVDAQAPTAVPVESLPPAELPAELPIEPAETAEPIVDSEPITTTDTLEDTDPVTTTDTLVTPEPIEDTEILTTTDTLVEGESTITTGDGSVVEMTFDTTGDAATEPVAPADTAGSDTSLPPTPAPADTYGIPTEEATLPAETDILTGTADLAPPADTTSVIVQP
jgi:hypothetical protein